ncbi:MAG: ribosome recycling factor [Phycisphaeraceae bacterium]
MDINAIEKEAKGQMHKAVEYLKSELKGVRTGRATPALVEFVKVEAYGTESELRSLAMVQAPEPSQLLVKPFDPGTVQDIIKGIEKAGLGLNPQADGKQVRISIPPLSGDRRKELIGSCKAMGEQAKVAIRNSRRDANKHIDQLKNDKSLGLSEDDIKAAKDDVQELLKQNESEVDSLVAAKTKQIEEV